MKGLIKVFIKYFKKLDFEKYNKELWFIDYAKITDIDVLPGEKWKNFGTINGVDYTNMYNVSDFGRVKSLDRYVNRNERQVFLKGKILSQAKDHKGYYHVQLSKDGKEHPAKVHRVVAVAFCKNDDPINKNYINHISEVKFDNRADNLEWCTNKYNLNYSECGKRTGVILKKKYANGEIEKNTKPVIQLSLSGEFILRYDSITDVEKNGFNRRNVNQCCLCQRKKHKGYIWMYESEYTEENVKKRIESVQSFAKRKPVVQLTLNEEYIKTWPSVKSTESLGYCWTNIAQCCRHRTNTAYGYKWMYLSEYKNISL